MVALYHYAAQGPEDLDFSQGDTIDVLGEGEPAGRAGGDASSHLRRVVCPTVNEEWLEGHCAGSIGIFPSCYGYRENAESSTCL